MESIMKNKTLIFISLLCSGSLSHLINGAQELWALLPDVNAGAREVFRPEGELLADLTGDPHAPTPPIKKRVVNVSQSALEEADRLQANRGTKRKAAHAINDNAATPSVKYPTPEAVNTARSAIKQQLMASGVNSELPLFAEKLFSQNEIFGLRKDAKAKLNKAKKEKQELEENAESLHEKRKNDLAYLQGPGAEECQAEIDKQYNKNRKRLREIEQEVEELLDQLAGPQHGGAGSFSAPPRQSYDNLPGPRSKSVL
jgi:hypothetical protein